ncbi:hypothetical protein NP233_g4740 [Leucocoprinus birnbaumii]|uniref:O-methyltransferase C-terminal domain-containing protein n=1 Tax=Leucocoprinus birnbaumii TaxID=56174 RepID=A0AAD5VXT5_9AGAR|nr:hypothetical protein NP233_g4740 [Leucocoprinus birnbaumii]
MESTSEILSLQTTLVEALDVFRAEIAASKLPEPSLNTSRPHPMDDITYLSTPRMFEARKAALACLGLLKTLVRAPYDALAADTLSGYVPASLRLAADLDLATIIGDTEDGMDRNELHNKSAVYLPDMINHPDPAYRRKTDPSHCAFQMAYDTDLPYLGPISWCSSVRGEATRLALVMDAIGAVSDAGVVTDFPWKEIWEGKDAIVDIGGGQGTLCCSLAIRYPEIKRLIVQDLPACQEAAESNIASKNLLERVSFEVQDFFTPQKRNGKYIFILQNVLHDWSTEDGALILRQVRDVLNEENKLLIIESLIQSAVASNAGPSVAESLSKLDSLVYSIIPPPPFVPVDFGQASHIQNAMNLGLLAVCNAFERTPHQMEEMVAKAGLRIKEVHPTRCSIAFIHSAVAQFQS